MTTAPRRKPGIVVNTAMNGVAQFAPVISTRVFFPLLVHAFGVGGYGVYVMALSVTGLATMLDFGIGASTVRLVARHVSLDDTEGFGRVVANAFGLMLLVGLLLGAVVAGVGLIAGSVFNVTGAQAGMLRTLLFIGGAMQVWFWPTSVAATVLAGLERFDLVARASLVGTLASTVAIAVVLLTRSGPVVLMALGAGVMVLTSIMNARSLMAVRPAGRLVLTPSPPLAQEIIAGGIPVFIASVTQFFNREQADRLVVGIVIGPAGVVLYEVAAKLSMLVAQVMGLTTSALLPVASAMGAREDNEGLRDLFVKGGRYVTLAIVPIMAVVFVLSGPFIAAWFGPRYETSVSVARLLILAQFFVPLYQTGDAVLISKGRLSAWVGWGLMLAFLNLGLSIVFVQIYGVAGVAVGTFIVGMLDFPLFARLILRETRTPIKTWLAAARGGYLLVPVAVGVAAIAAATPLVRTLPGIAAAGVLGVGAYWGCAYMFALTAGERAWFVARIRGVAGRFVPGGDGR